MPAGVRGFCFEVGQSRMRSIRTAAVAAMTIPCLLFMSACGPVETVEDGIPPHSTVVENELAELRVEPGVVYPCDGSDRAVARVAWKVKDPAVRSVQVQVGGDPATRQVFIAGGPQGEGYTGRWVAGGTRFHLVDADTRRELALFQVAGGACR